MGTWTSNSFSLEISPDTWYYRLIGIISSIDCGGIESYKKLCTRYPKLNRIIASPVFGIAEIERTNIGVNPDETFCTVYIFPILKNGRIYNEEDLDFDEEMYLPTISGCHDRFKKHAADLADRAAFDTEP